MITGIHALIYSERADRVRDFFRDTIGLSSVDAGGGWPIFALPPAELAIHPADKGSHELYLMCDDLHATMADLEAQGVEFSRPVSEQSWGLVTAIRLSAETELPLGDYAETLRSMALLHEIHAQNLAEPKARRPVLRFVSWAVRKLQKYWK